MGESGEGLLCPTCKQCVGSRPGTCCDRCEIWSHIDFEQINPEFHSFLDNSYLGYTCLVCTHEIQCKDLNESIGMDGRFMQKSNPEVDSKETHRKVGYEPDIVYQGDCCLAPRINMPKPADSVPSIV